MLGQPTEYFNVETMRGRGHADYPTEPAAQLAEVLRLGATPNGVYGLKLFTRHFEAIADTGWAERLPALKFIHLTRLDLLGQAISHVRASQTWQWTAYRPPKGEPRYDFQTIRGELVALINAQARWTYYLARNGAPVLHLIYEQMIQDPQGTADAVARFVGVETPVQIDPAQIRATPQRDALNEAWRERFVAQARNLKSLA